MFLGLDFGTSGARCCVLDAAAVAVHEATVDFPPSPDEDRVAQWLDALETLVGGVPATLRRHLRAVAIDGTSATCLLCDAAGTPLLPPLMYDDARAGQEAGAVAALAGPGHVAAAVTSSLAKLLWFARQPAFQAARYFFHQADWLGFRLHGQAGVSDWHNALKLGYDPGRLAYPDWLRALPVAPLLPEVRAPGAVIGPPTAAVVARLGLPGDCRVVAGTTDANAAFLASGIDAPGTGLSSLGSTLVLKILSPVRVEAGEAGIYSHRLGDAWLAGGASNAGGAALRQFFSPAELVRLSARIDPDTVSAHDYYPLPRPGERFPVNDPGLAPRLTPRPADDAEFLHGLLEGLARIEARGYRRLAELGAPYPVRVLTAGGGAANEVWAQIRARHLGVPVAPAPRLDAAFGAALLARGLRGAGAGGAPGRLRSPACER